MPDSDIRAHIPQPLHIRVPGSVANLGPGFDTLAVAVSLYLELDVMLLPGHGELTFHFPAGAPVGANFVERAFRHMVAQTGAAPPSMHVEVRTEIPAKSGLGSSAAATVAGLRLFASTCPPTGAANLHPLDDHALLNAAHQLEGHPDNVAACLLGGLAISMEQQDGTVAAVSAPWPAAIHLLVLTPEYPLSTQHARNALPGHVPFADAVRNLQRVAMLVRALDTGNLSYLREAFQDTLHQPYRQALVPGLAEHLALRHPDLIGTSLSGAGPSLVAFSLGRSAAMQVLVESTYRATGLPFTTRWLTAHQPQSHTAAQG